MTIVVDRITGPNTVNRTTTGVGASPARPGVVVARTERIVVANDGRGPMGFQGDQGNPGEVTIIEPPDPGDSFTLALEGAMA